VKFEARAPADLAGLDGLLVFASDDSQDGRQLQERSDSRCATLLAFSQPGEVSDREGVVVEFSADARIARPLRKRKLIEGCPQVRMPLVLSTSPAWPGEDCSYGPPKHNSRPEGGCQHYMR
jgi:hypothetical protein